VGCRVKVWGLVVVSKEWQVGVEGGFVEGVAAPGAVRRVGGMHLKGGAGGYRLVSMWVWVWVGV